MEDFDIAPSKIGETRPAHRRPRCRRRPAPATRRPGQRTPVCRLRPNRMGRVFPGAARDGPAPPGHPAGGRNGDGPPAAGAGRTARLAGQQAGVQAGLPPCDPRRPSGHRGLRPVCRNLRGQSGVARGGDAPRRRRARSPGDPHHVARQGNRARRRASEEALRAAAVSQAFRDEPEPAGAAGQVAARAWAPRRDPADRGSAEPPRARQLGDARGRARRRQDRHCRGTRAPHRV